MNLYQVTFTLAGEVKTVSVSAKSLSDAMDIVKIYNKEPVKHLYSQEVDKENMLLERISAEIVANYYDHYKVQKVISSGDKLFILTQENEVVEYIIHDIAVGYPCTYGSWSIGFYISSEDEPEHFVPYDIIKELMRDGLVWRENDETFASTLREIRAANKNVYN